MSMLWLIWATVTPVILWRLHNRGIFDGLPTNLTDTSAIVWAAGTHQVRAIASNCQAHPETRIKGYCLEVCHRIMSTTGSEVGTQALDTWLIRYYSGTRPDNAEGGGWLAYRLRQQNKWSREAAGSLRYESLGQRQDNANYVLQQGLDRVIETTDPSTVFPRVDSMEATIPLAQHARDSNSPITRTLRGFFSVQWSKSRLRDLEIPKFLTKQDSTTTYDFNDAEPKMSPLRAYITRTAIHPTEGNSPKNDRQIPSGAV